MMKNLENNGLLGYENSKRKKIKENLFRDAGYDDIYNTSSNERQQPDNSSMEQLSAYMADEQERWSQPLDAKKREADYISSARDFMVPEDNELRRRRQFVISDRAVQDATDEYYNNRVKGVFEQERASAAEKAMAAYKKNVSVIGADPVAATGAMRDEADPKRVVYNTMQQLPDEELDEIADSYARYAGLSPDKYRKAVLEPALEQRMMERYVEDDTPKSSAEYIARSAFDNSLTGKLVNLGQKAYSPSSSQDEVSRAGLAAYNASRPENLAAGIGSLAVDMPAFAALGGLSSKVAGKALSGLSKGLSANLVKKYSSRGLVMPQAERIIKRAMVGKMSAKIAQSSSIQGLTLGGYDAANSMADDLLANDGINIDKAVDAYAHGLVTGAAVGAVGTPLKELSRGLTGGKKAAASAGVLGAESAVFTLSSNAGELMSGVDVEPIDLLYDYGESLATLGAMKLAHWRPSGGSVKLGADGRLKPKLRLSTGEAREISNAGVNPGIFISDLEGSFKSSATKSPKELETIKNDYIKLMNSNELSAATRSKLLYLVENKVTSTPPIAVDCSIREVEGGGYSATLIDANGRRISTRDFSNTKELETFLLVNRSELRKNKIANYEEILLGKYDSENFFRQAGIYAKETGTDINEIAEAMYKKVNNEHVNRREMMMLTDIMKRTSYGDSSVGVMLQNVRRQLEREYNLKEGSLLASIDRKAYRCSINENEALDKYLKIMQNEVQELEKGTTEERAEQLGRGFKLHSKSWSENERIKNDERRNYINFVNSNDADWLNTGSFPDLVEGGEASTTKRMRIPKSWDKPYVWSYLDRRNSYQDMKRYQDRAKDIAARLGTRLKFIFDERELNDVVDDAEFNNKVRAVGWFDASNGETYINLPNVKDMGELERTIVHEVVGHRGLSNLFGQYIFDFYDELYNMADPGVKKGISEMERIYSRPGYIPVEEYLAHLAEKAVHTRNERSILERLKDAVNKKLEEWKIISPGRGKITTKDLCRFLASHHDAMLKGIKPDDYRAKVFGRFKTAHRDGDYYDWETYRKDIEKRIADKTIYKDTPDYLLPDRKFIYDDFLSEYKYYNPEKNTPENKYRFIGERGAENLSEADNGRENEISNLATAKEMERNGASPQEIWQETAWARGADGLWRSEIEYETMQTNDFIYNQLAMRNPALADTYKRVVDVPLPYRSAKENRFMARLLNMSPSLFKNLRVRDVVSDPLLYAAYPGLAHLPVKIVKHIPEYSYYDAKQQTLYINKDALEQPSVFAKTIIKPVQQMIQHYEGFENSISMMRADVTDALNEEYRDATSMLRVLNNLYKSEKNIKLIPMVEMAFADKFKMPSHRFKELYPTLNEYILSRMTGSSHSFSGNVETRNVMTRQTMSDKERMMTPPQQTEDFPREKQLSLDGFKQMKEMFSGPMDIIFENIMANQNISPMRLKETTKKIDKMRLTPVERKILESQYDKLSSSLVDLYADLRKKNKLSESGALKITSDILDNLIMRYMRDVEQQGLHIPHNGLERYNKIFDTRAYRVKAPTEDYDKLERDLREQYRKSSRPTRKSKKAGKERPVDYSDLTEEDKAWYRNYARRMIEDAASRFYGPSYEEIMKRNTRFNGPDDDYDIDVANDALDNLKRNIDRHLDEKNDLLN